LVGADIQNREGLKTMSEDTSVYRRQGFGQTLGFGAASALLMIDFTMGFADPAVLGGGNIPEAIRNTVTLLGVARSAHIPIAYTRHAYAEDGSNFGLFNIKLPTNNLLTIGSRSVEIVPELAPMAGELVLDKQYPSAFVGTILASWLAARRIDTVVIAGCTTSGCVRASAVDAMCGGFRPIVVRDCVGDRAEGPHEANLFDLQQKYADVVSLEDVLSHLNC
jgi:maleamate amidohydrolase